MPNSQSRTSFLPSLRFKPHAYGLLASLGFAASAQGSLLLISIDGLRPQFYGVNTSAPPSSASDSPSASSVQMPYLSKLARRGCSWAAVETVFPSLTYPAHTSLMTGQSPEIHGVTSNRLFDFKTGPTENWYFYAHQVKVPSLWSEANAAKKRVAIVRWPATVGSNVTYLVPEIFGPEINPSVDWLEMKSQIRPELLQELTEATKISGFTKVEETDEFSVRSAVHLWKKYHPDFLAVHLIQADLDQHFLGLGADKMEAGLRKLDHQIEELISHVDLKKDTVVLVGDHGFAAAKNHFLINHWLESRGFLKTVENGGKKKIQEWSVAGLAEGGMAYIYLNPEAKFDSKKTEEIWALLNQQSAGKYRLLSTLERRSFPGDSRAAFILVANPGWAIRGGLELPKKGTVDPTQSSYVTAEPMGHHGYLPKDSEMKTGLVIVGNGVEKTPRAGKRWRETSLIALHSWLRWKLGLSGQSTPEPLAIFRETPLTGRTD
jgi:predicted AlkP superfamily phosphohydrolase/phosphomutase